MMTKRQRKEKRPTLPDPTANDGAEARPPSLALSGATTLYHRTEEKRAKYPGLKGDLAAQNPGYKVLIVPVVVGNLGCVDSLEKELSALQFLSIRQRYRLVANIQRTAVMASSRILRNHLPW